MTPPNTVNVVDSWPYDLLFVRPLDKQCSRRRQQPVSPAQAMASTPGGPFYQHHPPLLHAIHSDKTKNDRPLASLSSEEHLSQRKITLSVFDTRIDQWSTGSHDPQLLLQTLLKTT